MSKVKKIAEDFLAKYPTMFSADFDNNKKALDQIAVIRNRSLRNQIAGTIAVMVRENAPAKTETGELTVKDGFESSEAGLAAASASAEQVSPEAQ
ncbi:MAG: hypothetical protein ACREBS_07980 [Nitrososphaerales archaeon]